MLEPSCAQQGDAVGKRHGFFLVVRDENKSDAYFALQRFQLVLHLAAQIGIERGKRFIEQQHARAVDQRARQRHALLLSAAQARRRGLREFAHLHHGERLRDPIGNFDFGAFFARRP